jgi:hypothetical protein
MEESMSKSSTQCSTQVKKSGAKQPSTPSSSHGDSPVEVTPKDVTPEHATWQDRTQRHTASPDPEVREDALLDEAVELTFPASDPIAVKSITRVEPAKTDTDSKAQKDNSPKSRHH